MDVITIIGVILLIITIILAIINYLLFKKIKTQKMDLYYLEELKKDNNILVNNNIRLENSILKLKRNKHEIFKFIKNEDKTSLLKGKNVLIVDDMKNVAEMNKEVLIKIGLKVDIVLSGQECIDKINNENNYDIIFMDNQMPHMEGPDVLDHLKEIEGFDIPVVILTADSNRRNYFINHCGFDEYIVKPLNENVKEIIMNLLF